MKPEKIRKGERTMDRKILNVSQVAELLQTNRARVYVLLQTGVLEGIRLGRKYIVTEDAIKKFLDTYSSYDLFNADACIRSRLLVEAKQK